MARERKPVRFALSDFDDPDADYLLIRELIYNEETDE